MSTETEAVAILAALNAVLVPPVYDIDEVPATPPNEYAAMALTRRFGGAERANGYKGLTLRRLRVDAVSKVSVSNARATLDAARTALEDQFVTVGSQQLGPIIFESDEGVTLDAGWWLVRSLWTYSI